MKLTKCVNGHFYDEEKFESCPHCAGGSKLDVNAIFGGAPSAPKPAMSKIERDDDMTVPLEWTPAEASQKGVAPGLSAAEISEQGTLDVQNDEGVSVAISAQPDFEMPQSEADQQVSEDSVVTGEPEPFVIPDAEVTGEPGALESPDTEVTIEPEPFELPGSEAAMRPEPFVSTEIERKAEQQSFEPVEPNPSVGLPVAWEMPQPSVEEIPVGDYQETSGVADPALEDQPTEIVDGGEMEPFVSAEPRAESEMGMPQPYVTSESTGMPELGTPQPFVSLEPTAVPEQGTPGPFVPVEPEIGVTETAPTTEAPVVPTASSPVAAMYGASANNDDDEHTVAFYDEIFVSKAPSAPVVPQTVEMPAVPEAMPAAETTASVSAPASEPSAEHSGKEGRVAEPAVFTAPPLQPAQALPTPCVGWLIALNGSHIGQDFHLRVGKNYIGRDDGMDIALTGDKSVSRNKHAIVVYEPRHHKYFIQPGESNELVYVNDEVVLLPMPLKPYDLIVIGDVELWFMPLCDDRHNWSEVIRKLQEQMNPNVH